MLIRPTLLPPSDEGISPLPQRRGGRRRQLAGVLVRCDLVSESAYLADGGLRASSRERRACRLELHQERLLLVVGDVEGLHAVHEVCENVIGAPRRTRDAP